MTEATTAPPQPTAECDLVMKGGITSGVVYPKAIQVIADRYRFRNLGGASAGAIAAVVAAACEYRRNDGVDRAFDELTTVSREIGRKGFVLSLFQPTPRARPAFRIGLSLVTSSGPPWRRVVSAIAAILRARKLFLAAAICIFALAIAALVVTVVGLIEGGVSWLDIAAFVLLGILTLAGPLALVVLAAAFALYRFVMALDKALKANWLGMCSGLTEQGQPGPGLTDWLHTTIQQCAGLPQDQPLTFRMLLGDDDQNPQVNLQLVTTDLSASRPVTLPLPDSGAGAVGAYLFDPNELRTLFPNAIVKHMTEMARGGNRTFGDRELYAVPGLDLPILVAARLSLSFPILLSTVPFWRADPDGEVVRHTMSDGGICSNFPIHFFDSLFPGRPTFGLDLQPWRRPTDKLVEMSPDARQPGFDEVDGVGTFFTQLLNAARNWRDNMQAELPGYRDRVCQIRLTEKEGGLNLDMPDNVVKDLVDRGKEAGEKVVDPASFDWDRHRTIRYQVLMQMLQQGLGPRGVGRPDVYRGDRVEPPLPFRRVVESWETQGGPPAPSLEWWKLAIAATDALVELAGDWYAEGPIDFDLDAPTPTPTLRILPRA